MSHWKEYKFSDLMEIKYGKDHKHLPDGDFPLYGSGGVMRYVEKPIYNEESILIPRKGTLGNLFFVDTPFWTVDTLFWTKINKELVLPKYLFYTLKTLNLASYNVGSAVPSLTTEVLNEIEVSIPPLPTQTAIASILSSLDQKIELNNKINKNLEALAQALFKQWFVDFNFPVDEHGNFSPLTGEMPEGQRGYKDSGGEMVKSELGMIPKGWRVACIEDITDVVTKGTTPTTIGGRFTEKGINFIKVESITESGTLIKSKFSFIDEETNILLKRSIIQEGDVLFSIAGTIGRVAIATKSILPANTNQAIAIIRPKRTMVDSNFLRILMSSSLIQNDTQANIVQAVQANLSLTVIKNTKFILPPVQLVSLFKNITSEIFAQTELLSSEIEDLIKLRDTLLPKLISGELEVNEAEKILTNV